MKFVNYNINPREYDAIISQVISNDAVFTDLKVEILLVRLNNLDRDNRWTMRQAINKNPLAYIVLLSSNNSIAKFAWKIQVFHFISYPITSSQLGVLKLKLNSKFLARHDSEKLKMNFKGGFNLIHPNEISVIEGQGNYCKFYMKENIPVLYTSRIGEIYNLIKDFTYIVKVNKSLVINVNHLSQIKNDNAYFDGNPIVKLKLSKRSVSKIKKELLWLN